MVESIFELDSDTSSVIYNLLDPSTLRALSNSSWESFRHITPWLVRKVNISRKQVASFCHFALKYDVCAYIKDLRLNVGNSPLDRSSATYDSILATLLEKAINLTHFAHIATVATTLTMYPLENHFPFEKLPASLLSLELFGSLGTGLERLPAMTGLVHLVLFPPPPAEYNTQRERAVEAVVRKSASTLESLVLGHALPPSLRSTDPPPFACKRLRHLSMVGTSVLQEQVSLMFPNLQSLEVVDDSDVDLQSTVGSLSVLSTLLTHYDCPSRTIYPNLRSFSGPGQLALNLSRYHAFQRVVLDHERFKLTELSPLSDILCSLAIRSLTFTVITVSVQDAVDMVGLVSDAILQSARNLVFLSLCVKVFEHEICCAIIDRLVGFTAIF